MLSSKIKISQVNNLTDARYFSAWGVDYLGFDINPESSSFVSPPLLKEIAGWVEGPSIVLESSDIGDPMWIRNYSDTIEGVLLERGIKNRNDLFILEGETLVGRKIVTYKSELLWSSISRSLIESLIREYDEVFIDIPFSTSEIDMILDSGISGLVVRGGQEEKIGFKSYDDLDELFEYLTA